jgi:hypothetical protein
VVKLQPSKLVMWVRFPSPAFLLLKPNVTLYFVTTYVTGVLACDIVIEDASLKVLIFS